MKIEFSFQLDLNEFSRRAELLDDISYGDRTSEISKDILAQFELVVKGEFDAAYDMMVDWDTHKRSYMDQTVNEIMIRIRQNRERPYSTQYAIKLA